MTRPWFRNLFGKKQQPVRRPLTRPCLEALEDRLAPAVTANQFGAVLVVDLDANGDVATVTNSGADIRVTGTGGLDKTFSGVNDLFADGSLDGNQTINLNGSVTLGGDLDIDDVTTVNLNGTYNVGDDFGIRLGGGGGGTIQGSGKITVGDKTVLNAGFQDIALFGDSDFQGAVFVTSANNVVNLRDTSDTLNLRQLTVLNNATISSAGINLAGPVGNYSSFNDGNLVLQPTTQTAAINIVSGNKGYALSQAEIDVLGDDNFGSITIGRANGKHVVTIGNVNEVTFRDPVTIRTPVGGSITVNDDIFGDDNASITLDASATQINLNEDIETFANPITLNGNVIVSNTLTEAIDLDTDVLTMDGLVGADVTINGSVNSAIAFMGGLNIDAGDGNVTLQNVGDMSPVGFLEIDSATNATVNGVVFAGSFETGLDDELDDVGTLTLNGLVSVSFAGSSADFEAGTINVNANVNVADPDGEIHFHVLGGSVNQLAGTAVTAPRLFADGAGAFTLDTANNDVNVIAGTFDGAFTFRDTDDLTVGTVFGTDGLSTFDDNILLRTGGLLTIGTNGVGQDITAGAANVTLNSQGGAVQDGGANIFANGLRLFGAGNFNLSNAGNDVNTVAGDVAGPISIRDVDDLTVGAVQGTTGLRSNGNSITLRAGTKLVLNAVVNTQPGTGGQLILMGKAANRQINVQPQLGAGNITLITP